MDEDDDRVDVVVSDDPDPASAGQHRKAPRLVLWGVLTGALGVIGAYATLTGTFAGVRAPYIWLFAVGLLLLAAAAVRLMASPSTGLTWIEQRRIIVRGLLLVAASALAASAVAFWLEANFDLDGTDPLETRCVDRSFTADERTMRNAEGSMIATAKLQYLPRCVTNWVIVDNTVAGAEVVKSIERENIRGWLPVTIPSHHKELESDTIVGPS